MPSPEPGIITADGETADDAAALALDAFPNPAASRATVRYTLGAPADVRLDVYDVLGRRVAVLAGGAQAAGVHEATLDTAPLAPGVYVLRLGAGSETRTARLTVTR